MKNYIEEIIDRDTAGFLDDEKFDNKWWLLFAGDKGGNHMKFHVEVINSKKAGSVDNVNIYCMFEAQDSVENMHKVWLPYYEEVKAMQAEGFTLREKGVILFLGGDYHFLDDNMGHQGSSASYPSSTDNVLLKHLQDHSESFHTPESCPTELRSIQQYYENYNENLADYRHGNNLCVNGKYHYSVVGPMIFPLKSIEHLVPASLHINLAIVLVLYNLLLDKCKYLDSIEAEVDDTIAKEKDNLEQEWEVTSLVHADALKKLQEHGQNVIIMINRYNRHQAVSGGDNKLNLYLSKYSDTSQKKKFKNNEKCSPTTCIITRCSTKFHTVRH